MDAKDRKAWPFGLNLWFASAVFQGYDYKRIYDSMLKPAFAFDGRMILDHCYLHEIGFQVETIGKVVSSGYMLPFTPPLAPPKEEKWTVTHYNRATEATRSCANVREILICRRQIEMDSLANCKFFVNLWKFQFFEKGSGEDFGSNESWHWHLVSWQRNDTFSSWRNLDSVLLGTETRIFGIKRVNRKLEHRWRERQRQHHKFRIWLVEWRKMSVLHVQHALKNKSVNLLQTSQIKNLIGHATKNVRAARAART